MNNIVYLPGCRPNERMYLFEGMATEILKVISEVFIEYRYEMGPARIWHEEIMNFLFDKKIPRNATWESMQSDLEYYKTCWRRSIIRTVERRLYG